MHSFSHLIINSVVWDIRTSYHMVLLSCAKSFSHIALHILLKVTLASMNIQVVCGGAWCGGGQDLVIRKVPLSIIDIHLCNFFRNKQELGISMLMPIANASRNWKFKDLLHWKKYLVLILHFEVKKFFIFFGVLLNLYLKRQQKLFQKHQTHNFKRIKDFAF